MQEKLLFLDLETTGALPWKHSIWQLSAIVEIDGEEKEVFDSRWKPEGEIDSEVPNYELLTSPEIDKWPLSQKGFREFQTLLKRYVNPFDKQDKFHFLAYNSPFDNQFLRQLWEKNNDKYFGSFFWTPDICVMRLAAAKLKAERHKLENFRLGTVCRYVGIEFDETEAHDALFDIRKTQELYKWLLG